MLKQGLYWPSWIGTDNHVGAYPLKGIGSTGGLKKQERHMMSTVRLCEN